MKTNLKVGDKIVYKNHKLPYKVEAVKNNVVIARRNIFGEKYIVILDFNKGECGHLTHWGWQPIEEDLNVEIDKYLSGEFSLSSRARANIECTWFRFISKEKREEFI